MKFLLATVNRRSLNYNGDMKTGIYCILNLENQRHYIGSAVDIERRWKQHRYHLLKNTHHNSKLQRAYNKYGEDTFRFDLIEVVAEKSGLGDREQFWIDNTRPFYNIMRNARSALGYRHTDEAKAKMSLHTRTHYNGLTSEEKIERARAHSARLMGRVMSDSDKKAISVALSGKMPHENSLKNLKAKTLEELRIMHEKNSKLWIITDLAGVRHEVKNLTAFCRENGLSQGKMVLVAQGKRNHHKGWVCSYSADKNKQDIPIRN